ncbi:hypothetical protein [Actinomadura monticuli]|uniref:Uncharacterized protein n=1 Tax=Actinomadura monticuli TaxID=3097367 RepID=A0ABV4QNA5_9ACTN
MVSVIVPVGKGREADGGPRHRPPPSAVPRPVPPELSLAMNAGFADPL